MVREPKIQINVLLVLTLIFTSGCQLARMELDPALADIPAMPVKGNSGLMWDRHLQFGPWQTDSVKEGWTKDVRHEVSTGVAVAAIDKLSKRYRFDMSTSSGPVEAKCSQLDEVATHTMLLGRAQSTIGVDVAALRKIPPLECFYDGLGGGRLKLLTQSTATAGATHAGEIEFADETWKLTEVSRVEGARASNLAPMSGFEIRRDGTVIAAVEAINGGRVWISPSLSRLEQDRAAAVLTALLLFRPVEPSPVNT